MNILAVLLTVLFVGLKLTGYITWSWLLVISPLLVLIGIIISFLGIAIIVKVKAG